MSEDSYFGLILFINCKCGIRHEFSEPTFPCYFECPITEEKTFWEDAENPLYVVSLEDAKNRLLNKKLSILRD